MGWAGEIARRQIEDIDQRRIFVYGVVKMSDLADRVNTLLADPARAAAFGKAGRQRAVTHFSWPAIAARTHALYQTLTGS